MMIQPASGPGVCERARRDGSARRCGAGRGDRPRPRRVGVETLTVALINSYVNGAHEQQIGEIGRAALPGFPVTLSAEVLPEFREYERALTACMNSYVRPKVADYVTAPAAAGRNRREGRGEHPPLGRGADDGARGRPEPDLRRPLRPVGRVAGALFRRAEGRLRRHPDPGHGRHVHGCRALPERAATIGRETSIGQFRIKVPSVNVHTVGAGGGSIAHVPELTKALRVGPQSAGAEPGPAAYGKGGDQRP